MIFLKRYRNYTCQTRMAHQITKLTINNVKYGVHVGISIRRGYDDKYKITLHNPNGKSQVLECRIIRDKKGNIMQPLEINYNHARYIEHKNNSYHGCVTKFGHHSMVESYLSYRNGILHGKTAIVQYDYNRYKNEYSNSACDYLSVTYSNGYTNQLKLINHHKYNERKSIRVFYYNIPTTYMHLDKIRINEIMKKTSDESYYYDIKTEYSEYKKYVRGILLCEYKYDDFKVISKTQHIGKVEINYSYQLQDDFLSDTEYLHRLSVSIHHKIERFDITTANMLAGYKWQMANDSIKFIDINLYKAPTFDEYTIVKYKDGKYRKKYIKYR